MTPELTALALAGLLQAVQFHLFAIPANKELGTGYTSSPRDRPPSRQMSILSESSICNVHSRQQLDSGNDLCRQRLFQLRQVQHKAIDSEPK